MAHVIWSRKQYLCAICTAMLTLCGDRQLQNAYTAVRCHAGNIKEIIETIKHYVQP